MVKLEIRGMSFNYGSIEVLGDIGLRVNSGDVLSLVGPNGSGKTTLLRCIDKILKPKIGSIKIDDINVEKLSREELAKLVGMVPQMEVSRFPVTVFDAVLMGRKPYMDWRPSQRDLKIVSDVLGLLGLVRLALRGIDELSGGEFRKVILARALVQEPKVLLLDEPTNHLDLKHQIEALKIIGEQAKGRGICVIMAMHDLNLAARFSDKIVMLNSGKIFAAGDANILTPENIEQVYGVKVEIFKSKAGKPVISPVANL